MMKILVAFFLLLTSTSRTYAIEGSVRPPEIWRLAQAPTGTDCINVAGTYSFSGEGAPGMALNFRGFPYALDDMLNVLVPSRERNNISHVAVEQREKSEFYATFFSTSGLSYQGKIEPYAVPTCKADRVIFETKNIETKGEATSGHANITAILFRGDDNSLIIYLSIEKVKGLFSFGKTHTEEYWAKFKSIKPNVTQEEPNGVRH